MEAPKKEPTAEDHSMLDVSNAALKGIRKFLETYPLQPPHVPDFQIHTDPNEKVESVLLPLWQKTPEMAPGSPHWGSFLLFLAHCMQIIIVASRAFEDQIPDVYKKARNVLLARGAANPWREIGPIPNLPVQLCEHNCFDTMRLSANFAHGPALLQTNHPSPYMVIVQIGEWKKGGAKMVLPETRILMQENDHGGMLILMGGQMMAVTPFEGERYQVELYLPEIPGMPNNLDEFHAAERVEEAGGREGEENAGGVAGTTKEKTGA